MACDVFVVGALHLDVIVNAPHLPTTDETVSGSGVAYAFGGKGGNQALAADRNGARTGFAGRIGSDGFGKKLMSTLAASTVDTSQVRKDPGPSGMSVAIVDTRGAYGAVIVSAANANIDPDDITVPDGAALVLLQNEIPEPANLRIAEKAHAKGARIILNAAPARPADPRLLDLVDVLVVNRGEAESLSGRSCPTPQLAGQAAAAIADGRFAVLVTLGADGAVLQAPGQAGARHFPAHPVDVVSTHGAGDMFVGALAARLATGTATAEAIGYAQAAAALHVASPVAERAAISPDTVAAFRAPA